MMTLLLNLMLYLLTPNTWVEWVWKLLALCLATGAVGYLLRLAFGIPPEISLPLYVGLVSLIGAPFFLIGTAVARRLVELQSELARMASTDLLTGLDNRRAFFKKMEDMDDGAILMMDVDHFKSVNDTHGHAAGDLVLIEFAKHIRATVRTSDPVARLGGEEFAVFLQGIEEDNLRDVSRRICEGVDVLLANDTVLLTVTMSVGIARQSSAMPTDELLRMADEALYAAKRAGRACFVYWKDLEKDPRKASA